MNRSQPSPERAARLAEIRRQIAAGTYETPEKLEIAVSRMLGAIEGSDFLPVLRGATSLATGPSRL